MDRLLTPQEVALALGIQSKTLTRWRMKKIGVPFIRIGRTIRYDLKDVTEWMETHTRKQ
ncbi:MAG: helix-turn-helix domain-containing protein [Pseudomonadota bacterium]